MPWTEKGMECDNCGDIYPMIGDERQTSERARVQGWHHGAGQTIGGKPYEAMLCPVDAKGAKKRRIVKSTVENTPFPGFENLEGDMNRERY